MDNKRHTEKVPGVQEMCMGAFATRDYAARYSECNNLSTIYPRGSIGRKNMLDVVFNTPDIWKRPSV